MNTTTAIHACLTCTAAIPTNAKFCARCGTSLLAQLKSPPPFAVASTPPSKSGAKAFWGVLAFVLLAAGRAYLSWDPTVITPRPAMPQMTMTPITTPALPPVTHIDASAFLNPIPAPRTLPATAWPSATPSHYVPRNTATARSDSIYMYQGD